MPANLSQRFVVVGLVVGWQDLTCRLFTRPYGAARLLSHFGAHLIQRQPSGDGVAGSVCVVAVDGPVLAAGWAALPWRGVCCDDLTPDVFGTIRDYGVS